MSRRLSYNRVAVLYPLHEAYTTRYYLLELNIDDNYLLLQNIFYSLKLQKLFL